MPVKIDNRRDILLLLLYSPGRKPEVNEPIQGRTRLVKMLFLFREEALEHFRRGTAIDAKNFYEFFPWNFGPFSRQVFDDLNFFTLRGYIQSRQSAEETLPESAAEWAEWVQSAECEEDDEVSEYEEQEFLLTEARGVPYAASLFALLSTEQRRLLREFKSRTTRIHLRALLEYVYKNYESQTTKSLIRDQVLGSNDKGEE